MRAVRLIALLAFLITSPARADVTNPGFESPTIEGWTVWSSLTALNTVSPIAGTQDLRIAFAPGDVEIGTYQSDFTVTSGRARSTISFILDAPLDPGVTLELTIESFTEGGGENSYTSYVIADSSTPSGVVIRNFVAHDLPALTGQTRIAVLLDRPVGSAAAGSVRIDEAELAAYPPACGDRIVDVGEVCDTAERASDTVVGACKLDCSGLVPEPVVDAGVEDAAVTMDASVDIDAGVITRDRGDCSVGHGSRSSAGLFAALGIVIAAATRRARRR